MSRYNYLLEVVKNNCDDWSYAKLRPVSRRVNRILDTLHIQQAFHNACELYEALHRWDIFRHFRTYIPKKAEPLEGEQFLLPAQLDGSDWRWGIRGRHPRFFDYTLARSCHWLAPAWLLVAKQLYPECDWQIASSDLHTSVIDFDNRLLFDPYYQEVGVAPKKSLQMMFGNDFDDPHDCGIFDDSNPYDNGAGISGIALEMWSMADQFKGTEEELVNVLNQFLDAHDKSKEIDMPEALAEEPYALGIGMEIMAQREDQFA